mmetsp:Transcript_7667/g.17154  ORF Transcript_7667/g.17154 Transcript_7667/m.17154 type:complete len:232 (-) Transcript_7667:22-717(-)
MMVMVMRCSTTPDGKVMVPESPMKSVGEIAVPSLVAHLHVIVPSEPLSRLTESVIDASLSATDTVGCSNEISPGPSSFSMVTSQLGVSPRRKPSLGLERTTWKTSSSSTSSSSKSFTVIFADFWPGWKCSRPSAASKSSPAVAVTPTVWKSTKPALSSWPVRVTRSETEGSHSRTVTAPCAKPTVASFPAAWAEADAKAFTALMDSSAELTCSSELDAVFCPTELRTACTR